MPRKCTQNWLDSYIAYTQFQEAPTNFHIWTGLSLLASTVRRNVHLPRGYFKLHPNLYIALVGPTGITKTSAADVGTISILEQVPGIDVMHEKLTSFFVFDYFDKLTKTKGECCITIYAPEMKTFLGDLNKSELVAMLTSFYTCPDNPAYRTKSGTQTSFKNVCVNLLACSTPEWLTLGTTTDEIAGGFTGRFVYVYEDSTDRSFPFPEDFVTQDVIDLRKRLTEDLIHISTIKGQFSISDQAKAEYIVWYNKRKEECKDERLVGYYSRKRDLVFKIAMLVSVAQDDYLYIDEDILHTTWQLLSQVEARMADTFSGVVEDPALKYKDAVLSQLARAPGLKLTRAELLRTNWHKFDGMILDRIIRNLEEARVIDVGSMVAGKSRQVVYKLIDSI